MITHAGQSRDPDFDGMLSMTDAMYGDSIVVRSFPAGTSESVCHFVGTLDESADKFDRRALLGRYGLAPADWTMVAQITRSAIDPATPRRAGLSIASVAAGDRVDRWKLEQLLSKTVRKLEESGMADSPAHPALAVVPLAIYRVVEAYPADFENAER